MAVSRGYLCVSAYDFEWRAFCVLTVTAAAIFVVVVMGRLFYKGMVEVLFTVVVKQFVEKIPSDSSLIFFVFTKNCVFIVLGQDHHVRYLHESLVNFV